MAVTSRNLRTNQPERWSGRRIISVPKSSSHPRPRRNLSLQPASQQRRYLTINNLLWVAVIVLASLLIGVLNGWLGRLHDDLRYGRPRISHMAAVVGHEAGAGPASEFIAVNLNRQIVVLEFPGGDATKVRTIVGPYLFGSAEDLTPVTLDLHDVNGDGLADLLVNIKNEQLVYINQADGFRMITVEEQRSLQASTP